jgi:hypothetical protein
MTQSSSEPRRAASAGVMVPGSVATGDLLHASAPDTPENDVALRADG